MTGYSIRCGFVQKTQSYDILSELNAVNFLMHLLMKGQKQNIVTLTHQPTLQILSLFPHLAILSGMNKGFDIVYGMVWVVLQGLC
jgi:hypothetical protein